MASIGLFLDGYGTDEFPPETRGLIGSSIGSLVGSLDSWLLTVANEWIGLCGTFFLSCTDLLDTFLMLFFPGKVRDFSHQL